MRGIPTYVSGGGLREHKMPAKVASIDGLRLGRLSDALSRATRSLTDDHRWSVEVERNINKASSAYCDANNREINITINLDEKQFAADGEKFVSTVLSLYYHEIAHAWFSPWMSPKTAPRLRSAINALEDKRIETFAVACFPNLATFYRKGFTHMVTEEYGIRDSTWTQQEADKFLRKSYLLAAGRNYLDPAVINRLRDVFVLPGLIPEIDDVVNQYKQLTSKTITAAVVRRLAARFADIIHKVNVALGEYSELPGMHDKDGDKMETGRPIEELEDDAEQMVEEGLDTYEETGGQRDRSDERESEDNAEPDESGPDESEDNDDEEVSDDGEDDEDGDGADDTADDAGDTSDGPEGSGNSADDESDDGTDDDAPTAESGTGDGAGSGNTNAPDPLEGDELAEALEDVLDALDESAAEEDFSSEINDQIAQYKSVMAPGARIVQLNDEPVYQVTADMEDHANNFARELTRIVSPDVDPGWDRGQPVGRINAVRYAQGAPLETTFDRWSPGHTEAFELTAGIMIDRSGSMGSPMSRIIEASKAAWQIRRGLELNHARVRTIAYSDTTTYDYLHGDDQVSPREYIQPHVMGGTTPAMAILDMYEWFTSMPKRTNKVLFILTDGQFSDLKSSEIFLAATRSIGVHVVLVGLGIDPSSYGLTEFDQSHVIYNGLEFSDIAKEFVVGLYQSIGKQVQLEGRY